MRRATGNLIESERMRQAGQASIDESLARIDAIGPDWFGKYVVEPGSAVARVERWTTHERFSHQLVYTAVSSYDHLRFLRRYIQATDNSIPSMAGYALIRVSIEASSLGLWLLSGDTLNRRLLASLRLAWHNKSDLESWARENGVADAEGLARYQTGLIADRDARGQQQADLAKFPKWSAIVADSERHVAVNPSLSPLATWKAASAFAHSNMHVAHSFMEHHEADPSDPYSQRRTGSRFSTFAMFLLAAVVHLEAYLDEMVVAAKAPGEAP